MDKKLVGLLLVLSLLLSLSLPAFAQEIDETVEEETTLENGLQETVEPVYLEISTLDEFLTFAPIKILMSVQPEELIDVQRQIADFLPESLTVVQTAAFYLEVIPKVINKGQGIRDICKILGIHTEEVISFGDAENDIPMLREAGMGVAMGNAAEAVKAAADMVTLSNNADGIAAALEKLL